MSRLANGTDVRVADLRRPFSSFHFVEKEFGQGSIPLRRLFSIARSQKAQTLVIEDVPAEGAVSDEIAEIRERFPGYRLGGLKRLSFWKPAFSDISRVSSLKSANCVGYALVKLDRIFALRINQWHVFEAVFVRQNHRHNFWPTSREFRFVCQGHDFRVRGCLYAQQNQLNKACAQVALRSLCATYLGDLDLTYRQINQLASKSDPKFNPANGLNSDQIPAVLDGLGIPYYDLDYESAPKLREVMPFRKVVYGGIESGSGAMLAFTTSGRGAKPNEGHTLSCFGHTFNEDSWAPHADVDYFKIGEDIRYLPSLAWTSSFIVHDDNLGPNLCIPQTFIPDDHAGYVVQFLPPGYACPGFLAEIVASDYFYSVLPVLYPKRSSNPWIKRLCEYVEMKRLILRTVPVSKAEYLASLAESEDWENRKENRKSLADLEDLPVDTFWMVEVSVPEVFPTNKRKLGEILIDGTQPLASKIDGTSFVLARFPEAYVFFEKLTENGLPVFLTTPSDFKSHLPLMTR